MLDPNRAVRTVLERLVADGHELGLQVAAYLDGQLVIDAWAGLADEASHRPVDGESLFTAFALATNPELEEPDPILSAILNNAPSRWALGYELGGDPGPMAGSPKAFGYAGLGTIGFADPSRRFAFAFLKNRLDWSAREMDSATMVVRAVEQNLNLS